MASVTQSQKIFVGSILILLSFLSTVFAANFTINTDGRVEFGQGLYQVGACDSLVDIQAESNGTNITEILIDGLDIRSCPDTYVRIKIYGDGVTPLNLYQESTTAVNRLLFYINGQGGRLSGIDFLNSQGLVPNPYDECEFPLLFPTCKSDGYLDLAYSDGTYTAIFRTPLANGGAFTSFTLETADEVF